MGAERGNGYLDHLLKIPGLMRLGCQLVSEGFWKRGALALLVSGRAYSVSSHHGFLFLFFGPVPIGPWASNGDGTDLYPGVVEGAPGTHKTLGSASTELPRLTCAALALCSTVPRVTKAMSPFGRLATLESPFGLVFGARGAEETLTATSHSLWDGVPTPIPRLRYGLGGGTGSLSPQCLDPPAASIYRQVARCPPPMG